MATALEATRQGLPGLKILAVVMGLAWAAPSMAQVQPPASEPTRMARERERIQAERERLEAQFAAEQAQCSERFAVTACVDDVRQRRRAALAGPRAQSMALDDAERRERAAARRQAVQDKQRRAVDLPAISPGPAAPPASIPEPGMSPRGAASAPPGAASARSLVGAASAAAQRRAAGRIQRQLDIKAGQARIEAREVARQRSGRAAAPLATPASAASSARK